MDQLNDLMAANPELGDKDNIFGGDNNAIDAMVKVQAQSGTNIIDYNRFASVPETQKTDYSKLTQISDKDVYNVVSVQETIIRDDGNGGNVTKETINYQPNDNKIGTNNVQIGDNDTNIKDEETIINETSNKVKIRIQNDETIILSKIGNDATIGFLKNQNAQLANCIFYDEDGYEIPNPKTKIEAVAEVDGDAFILNARLRTKEENDKAPLKEENEQAITKEVYSSQEDLINKKENDQFIKKEESVHSTVTFGTGMKEEKAPSNKGGCCIIL